MVSKDSIEGNMRKKIKKQGKVGLNTPPHIVELSGVSHGKLKC
jgi:hypothetical protein